MKKLTIALAAMFSLISTAALADHHAGPGGALYGTAGCGLGSMVFGSDPGIVQVLAATTNGSFGTQTFGITSGTSNCVDSMDPGMAAAAFVESNREVLAKDIARGSGETIHTLATIGGCSDSKAVARKLQSEYQAIFPSAEVTNVEVSGKVVSILRRDSSLTCTKLQPAVRTAKAPAKKQVASK